MTTKPYKLGLVGRCLFGAGIFLGLLSGGCETVPEQGYASSYNNAPQQQQQQTNLASPAEYEQALVAYNKALEERDNARMAQAMPKAYPNPALGILVDAGAQQMVTESERELEIARQRLEHVKHANQPTASDSSIRYVTDLKMNDGSTYTGQAKLTSDDGTLFHIAPHGKGKVVFADGRKYEGEHKDGKYDGQGVMTAPDGTLYEGEHKDGLPNGPGVYTWPNGQRYDGEWKDGKKNGQGVYISPDGGRYEGDWKDDKFDGRGVLTFPAGEKYEGEFKDGLQNGKGKDVFADGRKYEGEFKDGKKDGQGVYTWPTGERYEGEWKGDKINGFGKMVYADGRTEEGSWRDDKFVGSQSQVNAGDNQKGQGGSSKFGFVNVTAEDPTFEVFADGAFVGNSPAKLKLSEGPHTIEVRKEGFKDYKKEIRVADGSELNLRAVLEKQ